MSSQTNESKSNEMSKFYQSKFDDIPSLSSKTYLEHQDDYLLVDVRSPAEQNVSIISNAITMEEFESNFDQYQTRINDNSTTVVTYCTIGYRSGLEGRRLRDEYKLHGKIMNLDGIVCYTHACEKFNSLSGNNDDSNANDKTNIGTFLINPKNQESTKKVHVFGESWNYAAESFESVYFSKVGMAWKGIGVGLRGFFQSLVRRKD